MNKLTLVQKSLLTIVSNELFNKNKKVDENVDWDEVLNESLKQGVTALAFNNILNYHIDNEALYNIQKKVSQNLMMNVKIQSYHSILHKLMSDNNIPYCVLKGVASADYYSDSTLRTMGDVDFYVPLDFFNKAEQVLLDNGFKKWEEEHVCHVVFCKDDIHMEMHFEPAGMPEKAEVRNTVLGHLKSLCEKGELAENPYYKCVIPSKFHHGLIIVMHTYHHMFSEGIGLRHLCDMAVFFDSFSNDEFISLFKEKFTELGLWKFVQVMAYVSYKYLGMPLREWIGNQDEEACSLMIADIISGGNFGVKDNQRVKQGKIISDRGKNGVGNSLIVTFMKNYNIMASKKYKIFQKNKILYNLGWIIMGIRYVYRILTGKGEKVNLIKLTNDAEHRKKIYSSLDLFCKNCDEEV